MTKHPASDQLNAYLDGQTAPDDARSIEAHLSTCSECSAALEGLGVAAKRLGDLTPVELTPDERRQLRQAILSSRPPARTGWFSSMQWALAGGLVLVLIASIGFLFLGRQAPDRTTEADLNAGDGSAGGLPELSTAAEVEEFVSALPEVASAREGRESLSRQDADGGSGEGGGGAAGGSGAYAGVTTDGEAESGEGGDSTASGAPAPLAEEAPVTERADEAVASQPSPLSCADRLAALQTDSVLLLRQLEVVYRGEPALLAVYASQPAGGAGGYDRTLTLIVGSRDCAELSGPDLEDAVLYRSESRL